MRKIILFSSAVIGISGAFAFTKHAKDPELYRLIGYGCGLSPNCVTYCVQPAGIEGVNYICEEGGDICTMIAVDDPTCGLSYEVYESGFYDNNPMKAKKLKK